MGAFRKETHAHRGRCAVSRTARVSAPLTLSVLKQERRKNAGDETAMKSKRQNEIIEIISTTDIETQEELATALRERGYQVTQATVSRDIRELRLIKVAAKSGGYKYARPVRHEVAVNERLTRILSDSLIHVEAAANLVVVKTLSGSANVAAEALDNLGWSEIIGTIAGDNTIFVAAKSEGEAEVIASRIRRMTESI